jgi:hypothetical protein
VKKAIILSCLTVMMAAAQEKSAANSAVTTTWVKYRPADVKVLGVLDYGQSQNALDRSVRTASPRYRAFVFSGYGRDRVEITLKGETAASSFILTDSTLNAIGEGTSQATVSLPYRGPDIEVYYIVFPASGKPAHVSVRVKKVGKDMSAPGLMTEIKPTSSESNRQGGLE